VKRDTAVLEAARLPAGFAGAPPPHMLAELLDRHAPFGPVPLCPEIAVFHARSLVEFWEAAERLAERELPAPFWAYPWAGGQALARVLLDHPDWTRGRRVLDVGAGGGIATLAAARAGAKAVTANDLDPWALATTMLAAERQQLHIATLAGDITASPGVLDGFDLLLVSELAYERGAISAQHAFVREALAAGVRVLLADAGRTYFDALGCTEVTRYRLTVPVDLEGVSERVARVFDSHVSVR
jgi:predicted nicotinamide N-methyase